MNMFLSLARDLEVISGLLNDLWSHPKWSADKSVSFAGGAGQLTCHTKVCQLHFTSF